MSFREKKEVSSPVKTTSLIELTRDYSLSKTSLLSDNQQSVAVGLETAPQINHLHLLNKKYADIVLIVGSDHISAHSYIIEARAKNFLSSIVVKKTKKNSVIHCETKDVEFSTLCQILKYLYSDKVSLFETSYLECIKLIKLSKHNSITRLLELVTQQLESVLTVDNIYDALSFAHKLQVSEAETICLSFAVMHHDTFIQNPLLSTKLQDMVLLQRESILYSQLSPKIKQGWAPEPIQLVTPSSMEQDMRRLYEKMTGSDMVIVVENEAIACHKAILANASPRFMDMLDQKPPYNLPTDFGHVKASTFKALLRFLYYGQTQVDSATAIDLLLISKQLNLYSLVTICESKVKQGITSETVLSVLCLAYNRVFNDRRELQNELKAKCQLFVLHNIMSVNLLPLKDMNARISADLLINLQGCLKGCDDTVGPAGNKTDARSGAEVPSVADVNGASVVTAPNADSDVSKLSTALSSISSDVFEPSSPNSSRDSIIRRKRDSKQKRTDVRHSDAGPSLSTMES